MQDTILSYWFPNDQYQNFWFDGNKDDEIYNKFHILLSSDLDCNDKFAKIILYDQIARNICRHINQNYDDFKYADW